MDGSDFDARAQTWDTDDKRYRASRVADRLRATVDLGTVGRALEYGCGTGLLSFELKDELAEVVLADTSEGMLNVARAKIADSGSNHFCAALLDLAAGDSVDAPFDLVFTLLTLHHIPDTEAILGAFHDALNPGGHLVIVDLDAEDGSFHGPEIDVHHGFKRGRLASQIEAAGFSAPAIDDCLQLNRHERDYGLFIACARRI
ncbi:MAG: methyltransferase domain-containing protein [Gammaproteobacteria bacterium]|nr:methyltransferase domain-containing protein [Gammaproteobacteria bacterium]